MLAALILDDENLKGAANGLAESGYAKGTQPGSASLTNNITQTYQRGLDLVKGSSKLPKNTANWSDNTKRVIEQLQKGTGKAAVKARIDEAKKDEEAAKKNIPTDEGGVKPQKRRSARTPGGASCLATAPRSGHTPTRRTGCRL